MTVANRVTPPRPFTGAARSLEAGHATCSSAHDLGLGLGDVDHRGRLGAAVCECGRLPGRGRLPVLESVGGGLYPVYPHDGDQVPFDLVQHPVRADAQPAVGAAEEPPGGAGSSAKTSTARLTVIIPSGSAMKRTKVAYAISDQMILTGSRRTPQP
jgi:hypothetical protein